MANSIYECVDTNLFLNAILPIFILLTLRYTFYEWKTFLDGEFEAEENISEKGYNKLN